MSKNLVAVKTIFKAKSMDTIYLNQKDPSKGPRKGPRKVQERSKKGLRKIQEWCEKGARKVHTIKVQERYKKGT